MVLMCFLFGLFCVWSYVDVLLIVFVYFVFEFFVLLLFVSFVFDFGDEDDMCVVCIYVEEVVD